jgi:hypothetical protein
MKWFCTSASDSSLAATTCGAVAPARFHASVSSTMGNWWSYSYGSPSGPGSGTASHCRASLEPSRTSKLIPFIPTFRIRVTRGDKLTRPLRSLAACTAQSQLSNRVQPRRSNGHTRRLVHQPHTRKP